MKAILSIFHLAIAIALILVILLQVKGVGLSAVFGGESSFYRSRRGMEKLLLYATIALSCLFALTSVIGLLI